MTRQSRHKNTSLKMGRISHDFFSFLGELYNAHAHGETHPESSKELSAFFQHHLDRVSLALGDLQKIQDQIAGIVASETYQQAVARLKPLEQALALKKQECLMSQKEQIDKLLKNDQRLASLLQKQARLLAPTQAPSFEDFKVKFEDLQEQYDERHREISSHPDCNTAYAMAALGHTPSPLFLALSNLRKDPGLVDSIACYLSIEKELGVLKPIMSECLFLDQQITSAQHAIRSVAGAGNADLTSALKLMESEREAIMGSSMMPGLMQLQGAASLASARISFLQELDSILLDFFRLPTSFFAFSQNFSARRHKTIQDFLEQQKLSLHDNPKKLHDIYMNVQAGNISGTDLELCILQWFLAVTVTEISAPHEVIGPCFMARNPFHSRELIEDLMHVLPPLQASVNPAKTAPQERSKK